ncbi:MAG: glycoside hydrolase family 16 protein, partial [Actinomycetes bacterium]
QRSLQRPRLVWRRRVGLVAVAILVVGVLGMAGCGTGPATSPKPLPPSDRAGYEYVFYDNFDTPAPLGTFLDVYGDTFRAYDEPYQDTSRSKRGTTSGYYDPGRTLSVANGNLDAWLHYDSTLGKYLVSAVIPKLPTMAYGQFVIRLRTDKIPGYKAVPLLWPDSDNWPADGEIDFPEGPLDGSPWSAVMHYAQSDGGQDSFDTGVNGDHWHDYEIDWSPGQVDFLVDGKRIGRATHAVPAQPMHWVLQFETLPDGPAPSKDAQGHVYIDWVKVYRAVSSSSP